MLDDEEIEEQDDLSVDMDEDEPPWGATMEVGGTTYAVSLFWQPLSDPDNPMPEIKETSESVLDGADVFVIRKSGASQYGLGISEEGHDSGQNSAAISLAEYFANKASFVSVFKVPEGWWFLAVRNDLILSEEDVLYLNEEDAQRAFFSMMAVPDWGYKIAPEEWGIEGTEEVDLDEILRNTRPAKLSHLSSVHGTKFKVIAGGVALIAIYILLQIFGMFFGGTDDPLVRSIVPPKIFKKIAPVQKKEIPPWESLYDTSEVIHLCSKGIRSVNITIPGWNIGNVTCDGTGIATPWTRAYGTASSLRTAFKQANITLINLIIDPAGASAITITSIGKVRQVYSYPALSEEKTRLEINEIFQAIGVDVSLSEQQSFIKKKGGLIKTVEKEKYRSIHFSYVSSMEPATWETVLTSFSGLEISSIIWDSSNRTWKYEGVVYVK